MIFTETPLKGAYVIEPERREDERGWFARLFCTKDFAKHGLCGEYVQHNNSYNTRKGTIRGLHYQRTPYDEIKIVRCTRGSIFDVIVDIREDSETYLRHYSIELNESNSKMLYIPKGFAHGFQTLSDNTDVFYLMSEYYHEGYAAGIRWDDEKLNINWPITDNIIISERDKKFSIIEYVY